MKIPAGLCLALFAVSASAGEVRFGQVTHAEGEVIHSGQNPAFEKPAMQSAITTGDSLRTGNRSRAEIWIGSLSLYLGANSRLHFPEVDDDSVRAYLVKGALVARVRDSGLELAGPGFAARLPRPGVYRLDVDGVAKLAVREGQALVTRSTGEQSRVFTNQTIGIGGGLVANTHDALDRWAEALTEDRSIASDYAASEPPSHAALEGAWVQTPEYGAVWIPYESEAVPEPYHGLPHGWIELEHSSLVFVPFHHGFHRVPGFHFKSPPTRHGKKPRHHRHAGAFPKEAVGHSAMKAAPAESVPFKREIRGREAIQVPPARIESHSLRASPLRSLISPKQLGQAPGARAGNAGVGVERMH